MGNQPHESKPVFEVRESAGRVERQIQREAEADVLKRRFDKMERKKRFSIKKFQIEVNGRRQAGWIGKLN